MVQRRLLGALVLGGMTCMAFGCTRLGYDGLPGQSAFSDRAPSEMGASGPDATAPADGPALEVASMPDHRAADSLRPDSLQPDSLQPDSLRPDSLRPDSLRPDSLRPDSLQPDSLQPDSLQPDSLRPDSLRPDTTVASPDTGAPDSGTVPGIWVSLSKGTFTMGNPLNEACSGTSLDMRQQVTLTHDFDLLATEVTQASFLEMMGYNPSYFSATGAGGDCGPTCPVETLTWSEAAAYSNALSARRGYANCYECTGVGVNVTCQDSAAYAGQAIYTCPGYRLPTSAEWEYAYRAGTTTAYYTGDGSASKCNSCAAQERNAASIGWYCANAGDVMHPAQQKQPNTWGIYDMAGNVWEMCHDWYAGSGSGPPVSDPLNAPSGGSRVLRGGSFISLPGSLRAALVTGFGPTSSDRYHGFRCARTTSF